MNVIDWIKNNCPTFVCLFTKIRAYKKYRQRGFKIKSAFWQAWHNL